MKRGVSILLIFLITSIILNSSIVFSQANDPTRTKKILDECSITARSDSENIKVTLRTTQNGDVFVYLYNENVIPEIGNLKLIDITQISENNIFKFNYQNKEYITDSIDLEKEVNGKKICYIDEKSEEAKEAESEKSDIEGRESATVTMNCGSYATQSQCKYPCEWKPSELPSICSNPLINPPSFGNPTMEFFIGLPLKIISFILRPIINFFSNLITGRPLPDCKINPKTQCQNPSGVNAITANCNQFPIGQTSYPVDSTNYNNGGIQSNGNEILNPETHCNEIPDGVYDETDNGLSPEQYEIPGQIIFGGAMPPRSDYCEVNTNYLHEFTSCNNGRGYKELIIDCSKLSINNIPMVCQDSACIGQQTTIQPSTISSNPPTPIPAQVPNQNTCHETIVDSGLNYENYGEVSFTFQGRDINDKDKCINEEKLEEYACCQGNNENGDIKVKVDCTTLGDRYKCKEGRCIEEGEQTTSTRPVTGPIGEPEVLCEGKTVDEIKEDDKYVTYSFAFQGYTFKSKCLPKGYNPINNQQHNPSVDQQVYVEIPACSNDRTNIGYKYFLCDLDRGCDEKEGRCIPKSTPQQVSLPVAWIDLKGRSDLNSLCYLNNRVIITEGIGLGDCNIQFQGNNLNSGGVSITGAKNLEKEAQRVIRCLSTKEGREWVLNFRDQITNELGLSIDNIGNVQINNGNGIWTLGKGSNWCTIVNLGNAYRWAMFCISNPNDNRCK